MVYYIVLFIFRKENKKMEINSKDDLLSTLDEILNRLSVVEQASHEEHEEHEEHEKEETEEEPEVETEDEIEKLLNA